MTYNSAISNLERLENMQSCLGSLLAHQEAGTSVVRMSDLPSAVDGGYRGSEVRKNTSHSQSIGLTRNAVERESVLDDFLNWTLSFCRLDAIERKIGAYHVILDTSHHIGILMLVLGHANFAKDGMSRRRAANSVGIRLELLTSEF